MPKPDITRLQDKAKSHAILGVDQFSVLEHGGKFSCDFQITSAVSGERALGKTTI
jgi:hypothetical protein